MADNRYEYWIGFRRQETEGLKYTEMHQDVESWCIILKVFIRSLSFWNEVL